nr:hypothetical protein [Roseovarius arcticus]
MRVIGGILVLVGVGFLTSAGWIALEDAYSSLAAALVIACVYLGLGLILFGITASSADSASHAAAEAPLRDPATPPRTGSMSPLAEAFVIGLNAAYAARGRGPSGR